MNFPVFTNVRQAIVTKYLGATNFRGSRVKATAYAGSVTVSWDDALDVQENHAKAAQALAAKWGWDEHADFAGGSLPDDRGYAFVAIPRGGK